MHLKAYSQEQSIPYRLFPRIHTIVQEALDNKALMFDLIKQHGSPLNILFPQVFREKYQLFDDVLSAEHMQYRLYCTCKPNRSDALLREAASLGAYVDVSSLGEMNAAMTAGIPPEKISATGPKNRAYMDAILAKQSLCVIDNWHELRYLADNAEHGQPVMLRLSSPQNDGPSQDDTFGFHFRDLENLISTIANKNNLDFHGFACHYSGAFDNVRFRHINQALKATLMALEGGLVPKAINIGGGYQVGYVRSNKDWQNFMTALKLAVIGEGSPITWDNAGMGLRLQNGMLGGSANFMDHYQSVTGENHLEKILYTAFEAIENSSLLDFIRDSGLALYVEPGRSLMDQCGITLAEVNFTKQSAQGHWLVNLDMHHANLNAHSFKYMAEPIIVHKQDNLPQNSEGVFYYGSLCFASDLITFHKTFPEHMPQSGDIVAFVNTAGYRMDFAESEMLRHPNAEKICLIKNGQQWQPIKDNKYKNEVSS